MSDNLGVHLIVTNARIKKDNKYLIAQRSFSDNYMPWYRSIVGWKMEIDNWYDVLEKNLEKEILEEVWLKVTNIKFVWNYYLNKDNRKCLYLTFICDWLSWEAIPLEDMNDVKWLTIDELKTFKDNNLFTTYLPFINK